MLNAVRVLVLGSACGGNEIACNDDGGPDLLSELTFDAEAGATYYIRVAGEGENAGDIMLDIATTEPCIRPVHAERIDF